MQTALQDYRIQQKLKNLQTSANTKSVLARLIQNFTIQLDRYEIQSNDIVLLYRQRGLGFIYSYILQHLPCITQIGSRMKEEVNIEEAFISDLSLFFAIGFSEQVSMHIDFIFQPK